MANLKPIHFDKIMVKSLLILLYLFFYVSDCDAKTIFVGANESLHSIQDALNLAENGDTVFVRNGIYKEHDILLSKSIHLIGEKNVLIDGEKSSGIVVSETSNFSISGLSFTNIGVSYISDLAAIKVSNSTDFIIQDCRLENVFFGILIEKSKRGIIRTNQISSVRKNEASSGNGIHIWSGDDMEVYNNELFGLRDGIYFEFVKNSRVFENFSHDNLRYGLHFMFSNSNLYHHNTFKNNGSGVAVMFSKFITMHHNTFEFNWGSASYGLLLKEIYDAEIYENTFEQNTIGVNAEGSTRINYTNNRFIRNGWAVKIAGACYANKFSKNDFMSNSFDVAYNSKENDNTFDGNFWTDYTGYDLDKNGIGDIPYRPVKLFSFIVNKSPEALVLLRSLFIDLVNFSEKVTPVFTPSHLMDTNPLMRQIND